uniref:Single-stranded DNA-binding protein n=1 Tax=Acrobeloides nanus TaxID=290746 RepID=A0A914CXM9_9BILA
MPGLFAFHIRLDEERYGDAESFSESERRPLNEGERRRRGPSINRVELMGNLARNPLEKTTKAGTKFATFSMFTNVEYRRGDGSFGEHQELHEIHVFGGLATFVVSNCEKGSKVLVSGRLHYLGGQLRPDGLRTPKIATISADLVQPIARARRQQETDEEPNESEEKSHFA